MLFRSVHIFTVPKRRTEDESKTGARVATPTLGAAYPWPAPRYGVGPPVAPPTSPSRPYILRSVKYLVPRANFHKTHRRRRHHRTNLGGFWSSSRHSAGGGICHRRPSSSPCQPPESCVSNSSQDYGSMAVARWLSSPLCASCLKIRAGWSPSTTADDQVRPGRQLFL